MWNKLSMADKAKYISLAVQSGVTDIGHIRDTYNSYARGGYTKWKEQIRKHKGIIIDGDDTYDYERFFKEEPAMAWDMLNKDSDAHFIDKYKYSNHPSFSDESIYSGYVNEHNPSGIKGGHWYNDNTYVMSEDQFNSDWDTDKTLDYFKRVAEEEGKLPPTLYGSDGSEVLRSVVVTPQSSALNKSRYATSPNTDFNHAQDMNWKQRLGASYLAGIPLLGINPHTCLNTVTGFYDSDNTVASNSNMIANPEDYGYKKIDLKDAIPGDLIILSNSNGHPNHAVMFDSVSEGYGEYNGFNYVPGDTLVNYSNGRRGPNDYRVQKPLPIFDNPDKAGGDFSGPRTYLRYTGKKNKFGDGSQMTTINNFNIQDHIRAGNIDPSKVKIDLNTSKTANDNVHRWMNLKDAIDLGIDFNFDYNVKKKIVEPTVHTLPELSVTAPAILKEYISDSSLSKPKRSFLQTGIDNFEDTFGVSLRDAAGFIPYIGDALDVKDIGSDLINGRYLLAALGAGLLLLPNVIEKPFKYAIRKGKRFIKYLNYKHDPLFSDKYEDFIEDKAQNIIQKYGTPMNTTKGRLLGLRTNLAAANHNIRSVYLSDLDFKKFIDDGNMTYYFNTAPEYAYYCYKEGLNPDLPETAAKFIKRQETSIRGVYDVPENLVDEALTTGYNKRAKEMRGGDLLNTYGGLYTSNSGSLRGNSQTLDSSMGSITPSKYDSKDTYVDKIANRFIKPYKNLKEGSTGVMAKLHTDFGINPELPPLELIRLFKNKSIDYNLINSVALEPASGHTLRKFNLSKKGDDITTIASKPYIEKAEDKTGKKISELDDNILALTHPYFSDSTYERVLLTNLPKQKLANIVDLLKVLNTELRTDRWSGAAMDYDDGLFLPYVPSYDFLTLLHYSRLREKGAVKRANAYTLKLVLLMDNRVLLLKELSMRKMNKAENLKSNISSGVYGSLIASPIAALFSYSMYRSNKLDRKRAAIYKYKNISNEDLKNLLDNTPRTSPEWEDINTALKARVE